MTGISVNNFSELNVVLKKGDDYITRLSSQYKRDTFTDMSHRGQVFRKFRKL